MLRDFLTDYGIYIGIALLVVGVVYTFTYKDQYKSLVQDVYVPGNDELRKQVAERNDEIRELEKDNAALQAALDEKEAASRQIQNLIRKLPNFSSLTEGLTKLSTQTNKNHTEVMQAIIGKIKTEEVGDGRK